MKTEREGIGPHSEDANFERREHPRFAVNLPLEYWRVGESGTRVGCTGDISEGGGLLHLPEKMEVGREMGLRLFVDPGFGFLSIEARAQVIWKGRDNKQERDYRIGVKFVETSPKDMRNLKSFLASLAHLRIPSEIPRTLLSDLGISIVKTRKDSPEC
jgi:c-di-GMP-binding flagellar brake protein YcgR